MRFQFLDNSPTAFLRSTKEPTPPRAPVPRLVIRALLVLLAACGTHAHGGSEAPINYADLSLEELMNETITSVSKREQKRVDAASAVTVLSNEDIRRSGVTTVADALRLVPGMNVGSVNAGEWSVSARGFNGLYANKLLVLVDGRAVYSPLFAGVYWNTEQSMLEDLDRIEVIRGPGATVWGANAVNGVVNIVTRSAKDTQGGLLYGSVGDVQEFREGVRYGGRLGERTYYRVHGGHQSTGDFHLANGRDAGDGWSSQDGGFRVDYLPSDDTQIAWQADATGIASDDDLTEAHNFNTLGRIDRRWSDRSSLEIQAYYDQSFRDETARSRIRSNTADLTLEHTFGVGERNDIIWGLGYRHVDSDIDETSPLLAVRDDEAETDLFSLFVQDEFKLVPERLTLTGGIKLEHNDYTGIEVQPSLSAVAKPSPNQTVWAAISRAVRTPAGVETEDLMSVAFAPPIAGPGGGLYLPRVVGNPGLGSETLWAYELGYRLQPSRRVNIDVALFYNIYDDLISIGQISRFVPGAPLGTAEVPFENVLGGETYGGEISVTFSPIDAWRVTAAYSLLLVDIDGPASANPQNIEGSSPRNQAVLRSSHDLTRRLQADAQLRYVDVIAGASAYVTADLRLAFQATTRLELSLVGRNLLQTRHREQGPAFFTPTTEVPRSVYAKATWQF